MNTKDLVISLALATCLAHSCAEQTTNSRKVISGSKGETGTEKSTTALGATEQGMELMLNARPQAPLQAGQVYGTIYASLVDAAGKPLPSLHSTCMFNGQTLTGCTLNLNVPYGGSATATFTAGYDLSRSTLSTTTPSGACTAVLPPGAQSNAISVVCPGKATSGYSTTSATVVFSK